MKFNWGTGIALFYSCFVIAMVAMVVKSFSYNNHLVQEDYYQLDIDYEDYRKKRANADLLDDRIIMDYDEEKKLIEVEFPKEIKVVTGEAALFRPSDKNMDLKYELIVNDDNRAIIQLNSNIANGLWNLQLNWSSHDLDYYKEMVLVL